jgi:hypothetical protein
MAKKVVRLNGLLELGNRPEGLEGLENHVLVATVIRASLAQAILLRLPGRETATVFTAILSLRSLLFSRQSISVQKARSS